MLFLIFATWYCSASSGLSVDKEDLKNWNLYASLIPRCCDYIRMSLLSSNTYSCVSHQKRNFVDAHFQTIFLLKWRVDEAARAGALRLFLLGNKLDPISTYWCFYCLLVQRWCKGKRGCYLWPPDLCPQVSFFFFFMFALRSLSRRVQKSRVREKKERVGDHVIQLSTCLGTFLFFFSPFHFKSQTST